MRSAEDMINNLARFADSKGLEPIEIEDRAVHLHIFHNLSITMQGMNSAMWLDRM